MATLYEYKLKLVREPVSKYDTGNGVETNVLERPQFAVKAINALFDLENEPDEVFGLLTLNTRGEFTGAHIVTRGNGNMAVVYPRDVVKRALLSNSTAIIIFHNHPAGTLKPSAPDLKLTAQIGMVCDPFGIKLMDHIIVSREGFISFIKEGYLKGGFSK